MFKSIVLLTTLSFFTVSSAEAVRNDNLFNTDWFNGFKNIFKRPTDPMIPHNKSHKVIKEAILLDFRDGKKAVYNENGLKFNTNRLAAPLVTTPAYIKYQDVLINRRLPLSQVSEGLKNSKIIKKAELRTITASNTEVYTSTRCVVESDIVASYFNDKRSESKLAFKKEKDRQSFLNKKTQEFDTYLASFLNGSSTQLPQAKTQEKSVVKPKTPAKGTAVTAPSKIAPKVPAKKHIAPRATPLKATPRTAASRKRVNPPVSKPRLNTKQVASPKTPAKPISTRINPAAARKQVVVPKDARQVTGHRATPRNRAEIARQAAGRRATARNRAEMQTKRFATRRATVTKRPSVQRNTRAQQVRFRRR